MRTLLVLLLSVPLIDAAVVAPAPLPRPAEWAAILSEAGVPNLHRVTPMLYRCAQPTANGMRSLEKLGVKTVLSLRSFHDDEDEAIGTKLVLEAIRFNTWHPEDEDVARFFAIVTDPTKQPVCVHCLHGADRTGMMCALYRIAVDGWSKDDAIREMTDGSYGFHAVWTNVIDFVREVDVVKLKALVPKQPAADQPVVVPLAAP